VQIDRNKRTSATIALAAASAIAAVAPRADAQTWVNPNSGSWSVAGNWVGSVAPASASTTQLTFNAASVQTYAATNNIANPFTVNLVRFNNTSTGLITVNGSALKFDGASASVLQNGGGPATMTNAIQSNNTATASLNVTVGGSGAGTLTLSGPLQLSNAPFVNAGGSALVVSRPIVGAVARTVLTGGGTAYGLRADAGAVLVQGGTWNFTSAERGNDAFAGVNDAGFWSLGAGNSPTQGAGSITISDGASVAAINAFAGLAPGKTGVLTITGPGTTLNMPAGGDGRFGINYGTGTVSILNGAAVSNRLTNVGRQDNSIGTMIVDGAGSTLTSSNELDVADGNNSVATLTVSNGGQVQLPNGLLFLGAARTLGGTPAGNTGLLNITGTNSLVNVTGSGGASGAGQLAMAQGDASTAANGTLMITGGRLNCFNSFVGAGLGAASITVSGGVYGGGGEFVMGSTGGARMAITTGGRWTNAGNVFTASRAGETASIEVHGAPSLADLSSAEFVVLSGGRALPAGSTTLTIDSGGEVRANVMFVAQESDSSATVTVDGGNSILRIQSLQDDNQLIVANANGALGGVTVQNNAQLLVAPTSPTGGAIFLAPVAANGSLAASRATLTIDGATLGSGTHGAAMFIGASSDGMQSFDGGVATFSVVGGASADTHADALVGTAGTVQIGAGSTPATLKIISLFVNGNVNYNSGTLIAGGTLSVGGTVFLSDAGAGRTNKKTLEVGGATLTSSGVIDLNDNDLLIHRDQKAYVTQAIAAARNGGSWDAAGITSTAAKNNPQHNTTQGILSGGEYSAMNAGTTQFNGRAFIPDDTLVKYTYYGDTDFNGHVNFDDYVRTDNGFNNHLGGWMNGDFDGNGVVNFDDYVLIDLAFNTQSGTLDRAVDGLRAGPSADRTVAATGFDEMKLSQAEATVIQHALCFGGEYTESFLASAVPEPAITLPGLVCLGAVCRRRRRSDS
jgi:T5SS/PEP-CTERM-associated repeat protein